jgi:hypothetical protein
MPSCLNKSNLGMSATTFIDWLECIRMRSFINYLSLNLIFMTISTNWRWY